MMLSKSQYMRGLQCVKSLWLYRHRKDLIPETSPDDQMIFDQAREIGLLARKRFPGGVEIDEDFMHGRDALQRTRNEIEKGARILYEAAALFNQVLIRADILKLTTGGAWDLIEVKSSSEVKDEYLNDVAIQTYVLNGAGFQIKRSMLLHVNKKFVRHGDIDLREFFTLVDITDDVSDLLRDVRGNVAEYLKIVSKRQIPAIDIGSHCFNPYACEFTSHCWKHIPDYSIYDLIRASGKKIAVLNDMGVLKIKDIPDDFALTPAQEIQVEVEKSRKPYIDKDAIAGFLDRLATPIYFLDFETINPAIPPYDGTRPFQQITFQCSIHLLKRIGAKLEHFEFLGDGKGDPRPGVVSCLLANIGAEGTILAYNAAFECSRLDELAEVFPRQAKQLESIRNRIIDLAEPFRKCHFVHPKFRGRWSIKSVLPALVPGLSYDNLAIGDGGDAQIAYLTLIHEKLHDTDRQKIIHDLKKYCRQDTLAMTEILKVLQQTVGSHRYNRD